MAAVRRLLTGTLRGKGSAAVREGLSYSQTTALCWKCRKSLSLSTTSAPTFNCPCDEHVLLPPTTTNYFRIMDCKESFDLDPAQLKRRFHQLQTFLHPDKYTLKSTEEQQYAADHSSLVNKSYSTLSNPYSRGLYMLELKGVAIDKKDNVASNDEGFSFLEKVMSVSEEVHESPSHERLKVLYEENEKLLNGCISDVSKYFVNGDITAAKRSLSEMKYYMNIKNDIDSKLPPL